MALFVPLFSALLALLANISGLPVAHGLRIAPGSPCSSRCQNQHTTAPSEFECVQASSHPTTSPKHQVFETCVSCLQSSTHVDEVSGESDRQWFLYNIRYALDYCIFGYPNASSFALSPCVTAISCGGIQDALRSGIPAAAAAAQPEFGYCQVDGETIPETRFVESCLDCVAAGYLYLPNYLVALEAGCSRRPPRGSLVPVSGSVFSKSVISISDPDSEKGASTLSPPAIVGIVVGVLFVVAAASGLVLIRCHRNRKRPPPAVALDAGYQPVTFLPSNPQTSRTFQTPNTPRTPQTIKTPQTPRPRVAHLISSSPSTVRRNKPLPQVPGGGILGPLITSLPFSPAATEMASPPFRDSCSPHSATALIPAPGKGFSSPVPHHASIPCHHYPYHPAAYAAGVYGSALAVPQSFSAQKQQQPEQGQRQGQGRRGVLDRAGSIGRDSLFTAAPLSSGGEALVRGG